ncbi:pyrroloquinoline quinone precursor peptide PqqA [Umezawaea sp.]
MPDTENVRRPAPEVPATTKPVWVKPDFRDFDTPMEVTAYAART